MADDENNNTMADVPKTDSNGEAPQSNTDAQQSTDLTNPNALKRTLPQAGPDNTKKLKTSDNAAAPAPGSTQTHVVAAGTASFKVTATLKGHERSISSLKFSPDGKYLATACKYFTIIMERKNLFDYYKKLFKITAKATIFNNIN
jgi:WD40 repeat protein